VADRGYFVMAVEYVEVLRVFGYVRICVESL
jgi:hypothetical protein